MKGRKVEEGWKYLEEAKERKRNDTRRNGKKGSWEERNGE